MKITTKKQMDKLLRADRLGNHFPWERLVDWCYKTIKFDGAHHYSLRFGEHIGSEWVYHIPSYQITRFTRLHVEDIGDCKLEEISILTMPKDITPLFQGEVAEVDGSLVLFYSTQPLVMRKALATDGREVRGLMSRLFLQHYLDPSSYDDLTALLAEYDGAAIEFTTFDKDVGVFPHRNTVIWEVRHY